MKNYTTEEIRAKITEIWENRFDKLEILNHPNLVTINLSSMYSSPGLSFSKLLALSEFFETKNISDPDTYNNPGCETCDYGSSYGFTLNIAPDKKG